MRLKTATVAELFGISTTMLLRQVDELGLKPIPVNPVAKRMTYVFDKDEVDAALNRSASVTVARKTASKPRMNEYEI